MGGFLGWNTFSWHFPIYWAFKVWLFVIEEDDSKSPKVVRKSMV